MSDFFERSRERHYVEVSEGLHDSECEWRANGHYICHCSKRSREENGFTTPPEDLYFPPPNCSHCDGDLEFDGDGFTCEHCNVAWDSDGTRARFTDDYGQDLAERAACSDARLAGGE